MQPKEELRLWKIQIGMALRFLKEVKANPDNYTSNHVAGQRESLSLAIQWRAKLYRLHPDLRPTRSRQMNLFSKETTHRLTRF